MKVIEIQFNINNGEQSYDDDGDGDDDDDDGDGDGDGCNHVAPPLTKSGPSPRQTGLSPQR